MSSSPERCSIDFGHSRLFTFNYNNAKGLRPVIRGRISVITTRGAGWNESVACMEIYLPIAQISVNWIVILGMGIAVGVLSGMLGVSGGFITTPLLIFYGIPAGVAVATQASPIAAASLVGAIRQGSRKSVDFKMGFVLLGGGLAGSAIGVYIFDFLNKIGQIDLVVELSYVLLLGSVGGLMLKESLQAYLAARRGIPVHMRARPAGIPGFTIFRSKRDFAARDCISALFPWLCWDFSSAL